LIFGKILAKNLPQSKTVTSPPDRRTPWGRSLKRYVILPLNGPVYGGKGFNQRVE